MSRNRSKARLTTTGSRPWGRCPPPSMVSRSAPMRVGHGASPTPAAETASFSPWITRAGQLTRDNSASTPARSVARNRARWMRISVSASVSWAQSMPSSMPLVECGSVKHWPKKKCRKSSYRSRQTLALYSSQPCGSLDPVLEAASSVRQASSSRLVGAHERHGRADQDQAGDPVAAPSRPARAHSRHPSTPRRPPPAPPRPRRAPRSRRPRTRLRRTPRWSSGRSDRPLPRPSIVTTRARRARSATCSFQCRECDDRPGRHEQDRRSGGPRALRRTPRTRP